MFSVSALPADKDEPIDLREHFERSRRLTYGAYLMYWLRVAFALPLSAGRGGTADLGGLDRSGANGGGPLHQKPALNLAAQLFLLVIIASVWMPQQIAP